MQRLLLSPPRAVVELGAEPGAGWSSDTPVPSLLRVVTFSALLRGVGTAAAALALLDTPAFVGDTVRSRRDSWKKKEMQKCHSQQGWRQGDERVITQLSMHGHDTSVVTRGPVWDKSYASGYLENSIGKIILDQAGHSDQFIRLGQIYLANGNGTGGIVAHTNGHMAQ